jgi:Cdc6-like AAA superfamily ATPase
LSGNKLQQLSFEAGSVFTPGAPINERDLFAGRLDQVHQILNAISQRGYHAVLFGERGVGKTSLSNVLADFLSEAGKTVAVSRINCDASDTFTSLWRKALRDIVVTKSRPAVGFTGDEIEETHDVVDSLPDLIGPDDIRRVLAELSKGVILVIAFDEFDRIADKNITITMADTIKTLSDYSVPSTILLIGVADSVDDLVKGHQSIERALVQVPMPRMSDREISEIINNGLSRLTMGIEPDALEEIVSLSQGLPYITHLLALHTARAALGKGLAKIDDRHVAEGIQHSLDQWQQSITGAYYNATKSPQPDNIYKQVLLACALAEIDELRYFTAASVRKPLRIITGKAYEIPNFAKHLKDFSDAGRGNILQRTGEKRRLRYRFNSPIMRPYIIMRGFKEKILTREMLRRISED